MNIVLGTDSFFPVLNGVAVHIEMYANLLVQDGHKVLIVAPCYPDADDKNSNFRGTGIAIARFFSLSATRLFLMRRGRERFVMPRARKKIYARLDAFKPDLIHCHTEFSVGHKLRSYAKKHSIPVVMTAHTYFEYYMQFYFFWLPKFLCRRIARSIDYHFFKEADRLITPTEWMKQTLLSYKIQKSIDVIPTGMQDEDYISPEKDVMEGFLKRYPVFSSPSLLFVGRIVPEKNVFFLFEAFCELSQEYPDLQLIYIGEGFAAERLQERIREKHLEKRVWILPPVPRKDLRAYYKSCKIFAFPSVGETQGLVVLEALALGKPVAGVDAMGVGEMLQHQNYGGMLSSMGDMKGYVDNLRKLLSDEPFYQRKCIEALDLAKEFHINASYKKLLNIYEGVVGERIARKDL